MSVIDKIEVGGVEYDVKDTAAHTAIGTLETAVGGKVDKVTGKGLSTNDYTDAEKAALAGKVDKVTGKGLSTNDYTDADKAALAGKLDASLKGAAGGVAELDANGKVPAAQLPSYVDDVLEYSAASAFPATGETGKIYVDTGTGQTYRWSGSVYVEISPSLALGETSSTAYRGDRGKAAYDHAQAKGSAFASGLYKITTNDEGHVTAAAAAGKGDIGLGNVDNTSDANKPVSTATQTALGLKLDVANVYNGLDKADSGYALDARQGVALNAAIAAITPQIVNHNLVFGSGS